MVNEGPKWCGKTKENGTRENPVFRYIMRCSLFGILDAAELLAGFAVCEHHCSPTFRI